MRFFLLFAFALAVGGCTTRATNDEFTYCDASDETCFGIGGGDAMFADTQVNEARDATLAEDAGCGGHCGPGQICSYDPGCAPATESCHTDTGGDAVALRYCGCDGNEFTTSQLFPTQSYENAGHCSMDGGEDASDADGD